MKAKKFLKEKLFFRKSKKVHHHISVLNVSCNKIALRKLSMVLLKYHTLSSRTFLSFLQNIQVIFMYLLLHDMRYIFNDNNFLMKNPKKSTNCLYFYFLTASIQCESGPTIRFIVVVWILWHFYQKWTICEQLIHIRQRNALWNILDKIRRILGAVWPRACWGCFVL